MTKKTSTLNLSLTAYFFGILLWGPLYIFAVENDSSSSTDNNTQTANELSSSHLTSNQLPANDAPSHTTNQNSSLNFSIDSSFLCWYSKVNGNSFAQSGVTQDTSISPATPGKVYDIHYTTQPGFKLGSSISSKKSEWEVFLNYTWMQGVGENTAKNPQENLSAIFAYSPSSSILNQSNGNVIEASARSVIKFNALDIDIEKTIHLSNRLIFKPFFGIKSTYQSQILRFKYTTTSNSGVGNPYNDTNNHQRLAGAGLRMGLKSFWSFAKHFGLFFDGAANLVWTSFSSKFKSWDNYTNPSKTTLIADQSYYSNDITPAIEMFAGFSYNVGDDRTYPQFSIKTGWEQQIWFFNNNHSTILSDNSLNMQGLTLKFTYNF